MKVSDFQFTNPCLVSMNFRENEDFRIEEGKGIQIKTGIDFSEELISQTEAAVSIKIKLTNEGNSAPFELEAEFTANFRWSEALDEQRRDSLLKQNAPALLVSYARPIVAMITNASRFPAFNIPFINFTEDK